MQIHFFVQCGQQCCVRLRGALYSKQNNTQRIPSHLKRNTVTINPVLAHATRENSYPDLESSWRPPADQRARAKVCYFGGTQREYSPKPLNIAFLNVF